MNPALTSDMGRLQVSFYLVLLIGIWVAATVIIALVSFPSVARFAREPGHRLAGALIGASLGLAGLVALLLAAWAFWGIANAD